MNYFEFYDIPVSFRPDLADLRRKYLTKSKQFHPDFHTMASEEDQEAMLDKSTLNNQAYKTLKNPESCMKYVLELEGVLKDGQKNELPQTFLMEMMDINEAVMELQFDFEETAYQKILDQLQSTEKDLQATVEPILENYPERKKSEEDLKAVLAFYHKKKYLDRIRENMAKLRT